MVYYWRVNELSTRLHSYTFSLHDTVQRNGKLISIYHLKDSVLSILLLYSPILSQNSDMDSIYAMRSKIQF
jgi:hypothetical protein